MADHGWLAGGQEAPMESRQELEILKSLEVARQN
jgi:hypothetical protein